MRRQRGTFRPTLLTDEDYPERTDAPAALDVPPALIAALKAIAAGADGHDYGGNLAGIMDASSPIRPYTVPLTSDADAAMADVRHQATGRLRAHRGTHATALFGRLAENTAKLAMIAALSRNPARPVTEARDVAWASRLVEHCIATMLREADRRIADNQTEANHKRVLEIIRMAGEITRSELVRKTQFLNRRERDEIFEALVVSEQVWRRDEKTSTKPSTIFGFCGEPSLPSEAASPC
ncbi:DUF3987 domain-containing protein [Leptolyngbya sp. 15MV]|nr:DUF3987 domain-containing protein [Leptolyngbya sp. 15MV]